MSAPDTARSATAPTPGSASESSDAEARRRLEALLRSAFSSHTRRTRTLEDRTWQRVCLGMLITTAVATAWSLVDTFVLNWRTSVAFSSWLFLRAYGLGWLVAFVSFHVQIRGLLGDHGVLPVWQSHARVAAALEQSDALGETPSPDTSSTRWERVRRWVRTRLPRLHHYLQYPSLCWFMRANTRSLLLQSWAGLLCAALMTLDLGPSWVHALVCYVTYLSLRTSSGPFMGLQWDALILEVGLQALLLSPVLQFAPFMSLDFAAGNWPAKTVPTGLFL